MVDLVSDVVEFIRSNRVPVKRQDIVVELITIAAHSGGVWSRASSQEWNAAIDAAVGRELLAESGDRKEFIGVPVVVVAGAEDSAPVVVGKQLRKAARAKPADLQLSLFEMD